VTLRVLSYNIRYGGTGRETSLAAVIRAAEPDLVVLQEATRPDVVERLARDTDMVSWASSRTMSVGYLSRLPVSHHEWHRPPGSKRSFLEIVLGDARARVFGVHLSAIHGNWRERRRMQELTGTLASIARHQSGFHVVLGDFNTLAPGEQLELKRLPPHLRLLVWLGGRTIRWQTIQAMLDAGYVDGFRSLHPSVGGATFPSHDPHVRLDFVFLPIASAAKLLRCEVVDGSTARSASDHLPLLAEIEV